MADAIPTFSAAVKVDGQVIFVYFYCLQWYNSVDNSIAFTRGAVRLRVICQPFEPDLGNASVGKPRNVFRHSLWECLFFYKS